MFGVLCNKNVSPRLKGKFFVVVVKNNFVVWTECWSTKNTHI